MYLLIHFCDARFSNEAAIFIQYIYIWREREREKERERDYLNCKQFH